MMRGDADMLEIMRLADEVLSNRLREGDAACQSLHGAARGSFAGGEQRPAAGGDACEPDRQRSLSQLALRVLSGESACLSGTRVETLESLQTCLGAALLSVAAALGDIRARAESGRGAGASTGTERETVWVPRDLLVCPITCATMQEPVVAADGHSYERAAIEDWLRDHGTSPVTNLALKHKQLVPNRALHAVLLAAAGAADERSPSQHQTQEAAQSS